MKSLYDYLNDVRSDEEICAEPLTAEERNMIKKAVFKKKNRYVRRFCTVAAAVLIATISVTSYATGFIDNIIKSVSTGHNKYDLMTGIGTSEGIDMPKELRGLLYNADGSEAEMFLPSDAYFDENGERIADIAAFIREKGITRLTTEDGTVAVSMGEDKYKDPLDQQRERGAVIAESFDALDGKLDFEAKVPSVLPDGFAFHGASYYEDSGEYLFLYYTNGHGDYFVIHERLINDETAYETGTDGTLEELTVCGHKAVLMDSSTLDWEADGISVSILGRGYIDRDTLLVMAESMYS